MRILLLLLLTVSVLTGCSETESVTGLTESNLEIRYNQLNGEANPLLGAWILQHLNFASDFSVFDELRWLREIQDLEVAEYVVTLFFYPDGKWHAVLAHNFADEQFTFDSVYLVGEYMITDTEIMISGGKHGCFNVDLGTYTVSGNYLTLRKGRLSALIFEKVIVEDEPEPENKPIRLWD